MAVAPLPAIVPAVDHLVDRTRHHIAMRLLPFLFVLYIINYLDRTSVAYAAIGMSRDLGFSDRVLGMGVGVFFISYVALQIPGALLVERWSARRMISATMIAWGSTDGADGTGPHSGSTLPGTLFVGRGGGRFFPWGHRLSEPLVHPGGPRQGDEQLHGCHSACPSSLDRPSPAGFSGTAGSLLKVGAGSSSWKGCRLLCWASLHSST